MLLKPAMGNGKWKIEIWKLKLQIGEVRARFELSLKKKACQMWSTKQ